MTAPKTVLITGGATRIGREIALHLARQGWDIAVHCHRSFHEAEALAEEIRALGRNALTVQGDLDDPATPARIVAEAGRLTALVNNAARFEKDDSSTFSAAGFEAHMRVNLLAPLLLSQAFAAQAGEAGGAIVNIVDGCYGLCIAPSFLTYSLSKKGLEEATRLLALDFAPHVRVNAVAPGLALPQPGEETMFGRLAAKTPLQHATSAEEIARAVAFLLDAPSITGQVLSLNGGLGIAG